MSNIIAKRLRVVTKTGKTILYSHVIKIFTSPDKIIIKGERDGKLGVRENVEDYYRINSLLLMDVEFYKPKE